MYKNETFYERGKKTKYLTINEKVLIQNLSKVISLIIWKLHMNILVDIPNTPSILSTHVTIMFRSQRELVKWVQVMMFWWKCLYDKKRFSISFFLTVITSQESVLSERIFWKLPVTRRSSFWFPSLKNKWIKKKRKYTSDFNILRCRNNVMTTKSLRGNWIYVQFRKKLPFINTQTTDDINALVVAI